MTGTAGTGGDDAVRAPLPGAEAPDPPGSPGLRVALVVATAHCPDAARDRLPAALRNAQDVQAVLGDPRIGGFVVTSLVNRTVQEIRLGVEDVLAARTPEDTVLLYLTGHALLDPLERLFLTGTDTRGDRPASTALQTDWLIDRLAECPARRQVVVLDTPFSGALHTTGTGRTPPGGTRAVLTSASSGRRLVDRVPRSGSVGDAALPTPFTGLFVEGLRNGLADADGDGLVTVEDAFRYVRDRIAEAGPEHRTTGPERIVLARNPRPTGVPEPRTAGPDDAPRADLPAGPDSPGHGTEVAHALRVARALDPAQALASVQGLDAVQALEVARNLRLDQQSRTPHPAVGPPAARATGVSRRRQIGEVLVESGVITLDQLDLALSTQRALPGPRRWLGRVVVELGLATEQDVADCLAAMLDLEVVDLAQRVPAPDLVRLLPRAVAERIRVLVIDRTPSGELVVAASDPTNVVAFDDVRLYTRCGALKVLVATDSQIRDQLNRAWSLEADASGVADLMQEVTTDDPTEDTDRWGAGSEGDAPIVRLVTQILADGVRLRASDIHIECQRDTLRVRYRVDGQLRDVMEAPRRVATSVVSRIKIISGLDIAERRIPQDGRTRLTVEGVAIDARVSTLPSLHGEKVVIRLLTRGDAVPSLGELGLEADQLEALERALAVPQGLILITGPTGSGKTNTLYSAIARVSRPELNIVTLEDPVEVQLPGITQVGVSEKTGMTFSKGLRSILRQDPDIILVGEVRDGETAQLALKAALTGHMVLTTLHTNSAVAALTRLVDMGAEPFIVASSLTLSVAQRLVRRPCQVCIAPYRPDDVTLELLDLRPEQLEAATPRRGTGCHECGGTGYRGRTAVYEVLDVTGELRQVLLREPTEAAILAQARADGMVTLREIAIRKALQGRTTFEEALRVTSR